MTYNPELLKPEKRHPEKQKNPDRPAGRKPDWIRVPAPQGKTYAEIQAQWYDDEYWASIPGKADEIDALIDAFNAEVGLI